MRAMNIGRRLLDATDCHFTGAVRRGRKTRRHHLLRLNTISSVLTIQEKNAAADLQDAKEQAERNYQSNRNDVR
ncbi:hypothetical protein KCP78_23740 [Salmonella enterica subsp. enterica]|nr:hypothetical protein KCP78_23740 [Salmonella enterica subsp. enterica]